MPPRFANSLGIAEGQAVQTASHRRRGHAPPSRSARNAPGELPQEARAAGLHVASNLSDGLRKPGRAILAGGGAGHRVRPVDVGLKKCKPHIETRQEPRDGARAPEYVPVVARPARADAATRSRKTMRRRRLPRSLRTRRCSCLKTLACLMKTQVCSEKYGLAGAGNSGGQASASAIRDYLAHN